jgi:ATP-dependent Clp protease adapter protein ClpS
MQGYKQRALETLGRWFPNHVFVSSSAVPWRPVLTPQCEALFQAAQFTNASDTRGRRIESHLLEVLAVHPPLASLLRGSAFPTDEMNALATWLAQATVQALRNKRDAIQVSDLVLGIAAGKTELSRFVRSLPLDPKSLDFVPPPPTRATDDAKSVSLWLLNDDTTPFADVMRHLQSGFELSQAKAAYLAFTTHFIGHAKILEGDRNALEKMLTTARERAPCPTQTRFAEVSEGAVGSCPGSRI